MSIWELAFSVRKVRSIESLKFIYLSTVLDRARWYRVDRSSILFGDVDGISWREIVEMTVCVCMLAVCVCVFVVEVCMCDTKLCRCCYEVR